MKKYYSTQRPISIGTFPSGKEVVLTVNFERKSFIDAIGRSAYGYIIFSEPLSEQEALNYDLIAAPDIRKVPPKAYRNRETGELFTYTEMLAEWRERYEGIDPKTGFYQYHWHTRYDYIGS